MQITFLARRINIPGCEDYENTAHEWSLIARWDLPFKALIKSISYTKQSNLFPHSLSTSKLKRRPLYVLVVFGNGGALLFMSSYTIM